MSDTPRKAPVIFDLDEETGPAPAGPAPSPADAPPVPDLHEEPPTGQAMRTMAAIAARKPSRLARWFWGLAAGLVGAFASVAAWRFIEGLVRDVPLLGYGVMALAAGFVLVCAAIIIKEATAFARLARLDSIQSAARDALAQSDLAAARAVTDRLSAFYAGRPETRWGRDVLAEQGPDQMDADALLALAEREVLAPLDAAALREVEAAARQVAAVTALVPLAFADVFAALTANLRMIRRIAEIYGGRAGTLGSWRLTRAVLSHLVATGAVAVGDDMLEPVLGGGLLTKLSRRFGEGLVNGALTARVGVAALEVCRPMPYEAVRRPSVRGVVRRALTGLVSQGKGA